MWAAFSESFVRPDQLPKRETTAAAAALLTVLIGGCATSPATTGDDAGIAVDPGAVSEATPTRLVVELETADWADEMCYVALFQDRDGWLESEGWLVGKTVPVTPPVTTVIFEDVPSVPTAVSAFIDLARDENLTRNGLGIPVEPWGFSNDLSVLFGKPSFRSAMVNLESPETVVRFAIGTSLDRSAIRRARREAEAASRESS
jgi:uncharacterized protein (DUF2141 family)